MKLSELVKQNFSDAPSDATRVNTNRIPPTKKLNLPFVRSAKRKPEATMSRRQPYLVGRSDPFLEAIGGIGKAGALIPAGSKKMINMLKDLSKEVEFNDAVLGWQAFAKFATTGSTKKELLRTMASPTYMGPGTKLNPEYIKDAAKSDLLLKWMTEYNRNPLNRSKQLSDPRKYK